VSAASASVYLVGPSRARGGERVLATPCFFRGPQRGTKNTKELGSRLGVDSGAPSTTVSRMAYRMYSIRAVRATLLVATTLGGRGNLLLSLRARMSA